MSVRRISTGRVVLHPSPIFFSSKRRTHATFIASQRTRFSFNQHGYERLRAQLDRGGVALVGRSHDNRVLWWTKPARNVDALYWAPAEMTGEEVALVIWERSQRETSRLDRIRKRKDRHDDPAPATRECIPADVRDYVWSRDNGACRSCGRTDELQFDHVIPVSKGGATNVANLQVLCGPCNRAKGDNIG